MRKGPKGEKRLADVNAHAVMIAKIATGEIEDTGKNPAAVALRSEGGGGSRQKDRTSSPIGDCPSGRAKALGETLTSFSE
jgi:hypothetical protein